MVANPAETTNFKAGIKALIMISGRAESNRRLNLGKVA